MNADEKIAELTREVTSNAFLLCRATKESDLSEIMEIVKQENIASMVADEAFQKNRIGKSLDTLSGKRSWRDGQLTLATELCDHSHGSEAGTIIGSAGLNSCAGGYWAKRTPEGTSGGIDDEGDFLVFESFSSAEPSFEFSGTCVASAHRKRSVGTLHTAARIMFLMMHHRRIEEDVGKIAFLCANLLPPADEGSRFPFYEKFVKSLLGGIPYETADARRYNDPKFFETLLPRSDRKGSGAKLSLRDVEAAVSTSFGAVRSQTRGAERALIRYGFHEVPKYDALDAGRYVEATLDELKSKAAPRLLKAEPVKPEYLRERRDIARCYFSPCRSMTDFACARAVVYQDGDTLRVPENVFRRLELYPSEQVMVIAQDASSDL